MGPCKILDIVNNLTDKYTQDINEVSVFLIKQIVDVIAEPLAYIFDLSINKGIFPDCFKCAKVVPIFKNSGSRNEVNNYRPISVINCFAKILEKYAADQLLRFLLKENLINENQHGFLPGKSTFSCLMNIINHISQTSFEKKNTSAIFLDLSKAFDTCSHKIILDKLEAYGVRGIPLDFFKSFLNNRSQKVFVNNKLSSKFDIKGDQKKGSFFISYL